jgi:hypothetical protein
MATLPRSAGRLALELVVCRVDPAPHADRAIEDAARRLQRVLHFFLPAERFTPLLPVPQEDGVVERAADQGDEAKRLRKLLHGVTVRLACACA